MADWGPWTGEASGGAVPYSAVGMPITPSVSANTKGSFNTVSATDTARGDGLRLLIDRLGDVSVGSIRTYLVDVNIGGQNLINNLMLCAPVQALNISQRMTMMECFFPVMVPSGNAVQFRAQCNVASANGIYVRAERFSSGAPPAGSVVDTYGADTVNSKGTTITALSTATCNADYGSWAQLSVSTNRIKALVVAVGHGQQDLSLVTDCWYEIAIGVGAAGQEKPIALITGQTNSYSRVPMPGLVGPFCVDVPPGSRLAACIRKTPVSSSSQRSLDVVAYGIR